MLVKALALEVQRIVKVYRPDTNPPLPTSVHALRGENTLWAIRDDESHWSTEVCTCCTLITESEKQWLDLAVEASSEA